MGSRITVELILKSSLALVLTLWTGSVVLAQPQAEELLQQLGEMAKPKVEKIWEKKFDDEIVDMIVQPKEIKKTILQGGKKVEVIEETVFPKVTMTDKMLKFLDNTGRVKKEIHFIPTIAGKQWTKVEKSINEKFIGVNEILDYSQKGECVEKGKFKMFSSEGKLVWECEHTCDFVKPSPDGEYAIGENGMQLPIFSILNRSGQKLVKPGFDMNRARFAKAKFSNDGNLLAVGIRDVIWAGNKTYLLLFDKEGNKLWQRSIEANRCWNIKFSGDASLIAVVGCLTEQRPHVVKIFLFDRSGNPLWENKVGRENYLLQFSNDNKLLLAVGKRVKQIYCFQTKTGEVIWEKSAKFFLQENSYIGKVEITPSLDFILIATAGPKGSPSPFIQGLYILNSEGEKIWEKKFEPYYANCGPPPSYTPQVFLIGDGENIIVQTKEGLDQIANPFGGR